MQSPCQLPGGLSALLPPRAVGAREGVLFREGVSSLGVGVVLAGKGRAARE